MSVQLLYVTRVRLYGLLLEIFQIVAINRERYRYGRTHSVIRLSILITLAALIDRFIGSNVCSIRERRGYVILIAVL